MLGALDPASHILTTPKHPDWQSGYKPLPVSGHVWPRDRCSIDCNGVQRSEEHIHTRFIAEEARAHAIDTATIVNVRQQKDMSAVGFEPTRSKTLRPERNPLDHSGKLTG